MLNHPETIEKIIDLVPYAAYAIQNGRVRVGAVGKVSEVVNSSGMSRLTGHPVLAHVGHASATIS